MSATCLADPKPAGLKRISRTVWRRMLAVATSLVVPLALAATAEAITVSLQQVDVNGSPIASVTATGSTQTLAYANLVVSGSGAPLPITDLFSFATAVSWSTSSSGVAVTDLYTVNSGGTAVSTNAAMTATGVSMLFADVDDSPTATMNVTSLDSTFQRYISVVANANPGPNLANPTASIVIARIRFAVSSGITDATFSLSVDGSGGDSGYEFLDGSANPYTFTSGGGSIVVVPEPSTVSACVAGSCVIFGFSAWRSRRRRSPTSAASTGC